MSMKKSKAIKSRIKITSKGKLLARGKGKGHFNAKAPRSKKMNSNRDVPVVMSSKMKNRLLNI